MSIPIEVLRWGPPIVAALAFTYGMVVALRAPLSSARRLALPMAPPQSRLSAALVLAASAGLGLSMSWSLGIAEMFGCISTLMVLVIFRRLLVPRLAANTDGDPADYAQFPTSAMFGPAIGVLSVGVPFVARMYTGPSAVDTLLAAALGLWIAAGVWILWNALLDSATVPANDPTTSGWLKTETISAAIALLAGTSLAVAAAVGTFRFKEEDVQGLLLPFAMFAASILFGMLVSPMLRPARSGARPVMRWIGVIVFLAGTGVSAYLLATRTIGDIKAFYSFGVGLLTAFLVMLVAAYRPPYSRVGAAFGAQLAVAQVLVVIAGVILAFRWMTGYGAALCGVGLTASFPVLLPLAHAWAVRRGGQEADHSDPQSDIQAGTALAETVLVSAAFAIAVTVVRLFVEQVGLSKAGIDITAPYPLIGLVIGAAMPVLIRMSASPGSLRVSDGGQPVPHSIAGRTMQTLGLWSAAVTVPLVIAFFWREEATGAFLAGLAVSLLYIMLNLWLSEVRGASDADTRSAAGATQVLALGSGIVAVLISPKLIDLTADLTRAARIRALLILLAVVFVWVFVMVFRRLRTSTGPSA